MSSKKAESLTLNVIVIAVIVLIVLIVLILVFSGKIGNFNQGVNECPSGYTASASPSCQYGDLPLKTYTVKDTATGKTAIQYCCSSVAPTP